MGIRTSQLQHSFQMDIWSLKQSSQLPFTELPQDRPATIQMLSATKLEEPAFNTRIRTALHTTTVDPTTQPQSDAVTPDVTDTPSTTLKPLTTDR